MDNQTLKGKNVLLFFPGGGQTSRAQEFQYHIQQLGASVTIYDERPSNSTLSKIKVRIFKKRIPSIFNNYLKHIIKEEKREFDFVLIIRGEAFTPSSIDLLRHHYPKAKLILYLWDILKTNHLEDIIPLFDSAFSFDPQDCKTHPKLIFRPTYAMDQYATISIPRSQIDIDISFIGTIHSKRAEILRRIEHYCNHNNIRTYFYQFIPSRIIWIREKLKKWPFIPYHEVKFSPANARFIADISLRSKAILDINYDEQHSLSMRAFEAMMLKRKYITTNPHIKEYDFYNPANILVLNPQHPVIPKEFLDSPFITVNDEILQKYTTQNLVKCLLGQIQENEYLITPTENHPINQTLQL